MKSVGTIRSKLFPLRGLAGNRSYLMKVRVAVRFALPVDIGGVSEWTTPNEECASRKTWNEFAIFVTDFQNLSRFFLS